MQRNTSPSAAESSPRTTGKSNQQKRFLSMISTENCSDLRRVFIYFDEDGDGKISPSELHSCVRSVGGSLTLEEAEYAVRSSDIDGDGMLAFEEFERMMESNGGEEEDEELKEAFGMYTVEESGRFITPKSLKRMLSRLGDSRTMEDCKAMIRVFDLDGDGVLSFEEFKVMMR